MIIHYLIVNFQGSVLMYENRLLKLLTNGHFLWIIKKTLYF